MDTEPPQFLHHSDNTIIASDVANRNARKRERAAAAVSIHLHSQPPPFVPLSLNKQKESKNESFSVSSSRSSSLLSCELAVEASHQNKDINQFLVVQDEQMKRAQTVMGLRNYRRLLATAVQRLHEKQANVDRAYKRAMDLVNQLAPLQAEFMAWRAKTVEDQATIAALQTQLQQTVVGPILDEECGESPDAEPDYVKPNRAERPRACGCCGDQPATMVTLPCRHLSHCSECEYTSAARLACSMCLCQRTGSFRVFFT